ncbi:MAG: hypothetical protein AB7O66_06775 [Limisphaerales bacterium]
MEYRNGTPLLSQHPQARIAGQVHVVLLEDWKGTSSDAKAAARRLKAQLPDGDYVWHHKEIVDINGKQGVKMVLVPRHLNGIPHSGPASWRRAAKSLGQRAIEILGKAPKCVAVLGVVSWIIDPLESVAAPFGGTTTLGDGTYDGFIHRQLEAKMDALEAAGASRDFVKYREHLVELRQMYNETKYTPHMVPIIDQQLGIIGNLVPTPGP